ncbi:bZIP transcription factor 46-like [Typha angustifolia]|uniref:bZIP transcription factor 46-like n=1 Tax=Typha angustifolia TaxID=59011 RepID=UPI003C2AC622
MDSKNIGFDSRQGSIYSLTFDEFQSMLGGAGKDFGSMNMDEFLKNIWTAEETQAMSSTLAGVGAGTGLQRQGSSLTLPRTISQKTVDEVWRNLVTENGGQESAAGAPEFHHQRQPTLGEMTLEEFLARAGVVKEDLATSVLGSNSNNNSNNNNSNSRSDLFYGNLPSSYDTNSGLALGFGQTGRNNGNEVANPVTGPMAGFGQPQESKGGGGLGIGNPVINNGLMSGMVGLVGAGVTVAATGGLPANHMSSNGFGKENGDVSLSPVPYVFSGGLRGRKCGGAVEKVVERRQRRMIKNRESAARSRARKQAYTMELEAEVAKLKEQNEELQKKQVEMLQMQKTKVLELINQPRGLKKRSLERTQTGPW